MSRLLTVLVLAGFLSSGVAESQEATAVKKEAKKVSKSGRMAKMLEQLTPFDPPADAAKLPAETAELFKKMAASTAANAKVYQSLTADQLNFKPSDGTHTPRWNAEHISATQLKFFSQIYHEIDANVPVIDWSPQQMPEDYKPAHPKWTGKQEARRMIAVDKFCQRYSYLLADVDLDAKPPVTFWASYRAMLTNLVGHSTEHTDNARTKMKASDWPK